LTFDARVFIASWIWGGGSRTSFGLPLPLGANVLLRSLDPEIQSECCRLMRESHV